MSDFISVSQQVSTTNYQGKAEQKISMEEVYPMISSMKLRYFKNDNSPRINFRVEIKPNDDNIENWTQAYIIIYVEGFENPHGFHHFGLSGRHCDRATGTITMLLNGPDNGGLQARPLSRTFSVEIVEWNHESAMTRFRNFVNYDDFFHTQGWIQPPEPQLPMLPFVRFKAVFFYQTGMPGDPDWHMVQAGSEAYIHKPQPPSIVGVQPSEHRENYLTVTLNRHLIQGYDSLRGAVVMRRDGSQLEIMSAEDPEEPNSDRIELNLGAAGGDIRSVIFLVGSTEGRDWPTAPSKRERQQREYSEVEDEF